MLITNVRKEIAAETSVKRNKLQWGRGFLTAEKVRFPKNAANQQNASIEPPESAEGWLLCRRTTERRHNARRTSVLARFGHRDEGYRDRDAVSIECVSFICMESFKENH